MNGDNGDTYVENGEQVFPQSSYADCVKTWGNYFSLQHIVQSGTDYQWGNGWLSSAALGNPVSDAIEAVQSFSEGDAGGGTSSALAAGAHHAAEKASEAGAGLVDKTYTWRAISTITGMGITASGMSYTYKMNGPWVTKSLRLPLGSLGSVAKVGTKVLEGLNVWNYGVSFVGLGMCGIGQ